MLRVYWKGDYSSMADILSSIDWEKEFEEANIEAFWNSFKDKFRDALTTNLSQFHSPGGGKKEEKRKQ